MATKTVINCMEHSIAQSNQGISIIIDQHSPSPQPTEQQQAKMQPVYESSSNLNVIQIQHSNEQNLQQHLTLNNTNNKNNKTLIDINRNNNNDNNHDYAVHNERHDDDDDEARNELVLQINCSSTSSETSREMKHNMENIKLNTLKMENNGGVLTERGTDHDEVQLNGEKKLNLANNGHSKQNEKFTISGKYSTEQAAEKDDEESGQTASQKQQQQKQQQSQQQQQHEQQKQQVNGNSKNRENGQNSLTTSQIKLQLNDHTNAEQTNDHIVVNDDHHDDEKQVGNTQLNTSKPHYDFSNNRVKNSSNNDGGIGGGSSSSSSACGLIQREVVDLSHAKRSVNEENSNSLLTPADATTCTQSTTLLTINAPATEAKAHKDLIDSQKLTNTTHVVKIHIKPNDNNDNNFNINSDHSNKIPQQSAKTLMEKQITVVKIENLQELRNETTEQNNSSQENTRVQEKPISENIENKENQNDNRSQAKQIATRVCQPQTSDNNTNNDVDDDNDKMVQKPVNSNSAATVTVVSNSNGNANANGSIAITSGASTVATATDLNVSNPNNYLFYMMSSGQFSPCDTLDSGTGSDLESNGQQQLTSPNLQLKKSSASSASSTTSTISNNSNAALELHLKTTKILVANSSNSLETQQRQCSFTDSEESEASSLSCDSLHSNEFLRQSSASPIQIKSSSVNGTSKKIQSFLPDSLLREIKNLKFSSNDYEAENEEEEEEEEEEDDDNLSILKTDEKSDMFKSFNNKDYIKSHEFMQSRKNLNNLPPTISSSLKRASLPSKTFVLNTEDGTFIDTKMNSMPRTYEADKYYNFHVNEHDNFRSFGNSDSLAATNGGHGADTLSISDFDTKSLHDDVFAGYKDLRCGSNTSTIRSSKGTVRGVKNRVRNGIATFLQLQQPNVKVSERIFCFLKISVILSRSHPLAQK